MYLDVDGLSVVGGVRASLATLFFLHTLQLGIQEIAFLTCTSSRCAVFTMFRVGTREEEMGKG